MLSRGNITCLMNSRVVALEGEGELSGIVVEDKATLEQKIKDTGIEYDDAKESVAEIARNSFHGSDASNMMDVVTDAKSTDEFAASCALRFAWFACFCCNSA